MQMELKLLLFWARKKISLQDCANSYRQKNEDLVVLILTWLKEKRGLESSVSLRSEKLYQNPVFARNAVAEFPDVFGSIDI